MRAPPVLAGLVLAAGVWSSPPASAEEVVTATGTHYDARDVVLLEDGVRFTFDVGVGRATLTLPFDRISGQNLLDLMAARAPSHDGQAQLRVAKVALARGLLPAAAARFRRAAQVDPSLAGERDLGVAAVPDAETAAILVQAEAEVRRGRNDLAVDQAKRAIERSSEGSPLRAKAEGLLDLAGRLADRDRERAARAAAEKTAKAQAAERSAFEATLRAADHAIAAALGHRTRAADPDVSAPQARQSLELADAQIREARRLLTVARDNPAAHPGEVDARERDAAGLLMANHLDLADLYRVERRFDKARDRVRAVLVMDPQNSRAQTTSDRIEQDARVPVQPTYEPEPFYGVSYGVYGGGYASSYGVGYGTGYGGYGRTYLGYRNFPYVSPYFRSSFLMGHWHW